MSENLPKGWIEKPLADVTEQRGEKVSPQDYPDLQFIGMDHVESQTTRIIGSVPACSMKSNAARFYTNDVLYGRLRPYLNKVTQPLFDGLASAEFIVFPDTDLVKSDYLKYRLNAADFVSFASHLNEGDRPRVGFDQIGTFKIKVPPPKEQKRIVAKIEELFSELDKGIENLKTAREQLKIYRQAVLKHAFEGKLTANWREKNKDKLETADELLERIKQERETTYQQQLKEWKAAVKEWERNGKGDKKPEKPSEYKPLPSIKDEELSVLPDLPQDWLYVRLAEIARVGSGMSVSKERKLENPVQVPYLRVANVQRGELRLDEIKTMPIEKNSINNFALKKWDILFNEGGDRDKLGRGWVWEGQIKTCITQNHVFRATSYLGGEFHAKFISHWGNTFGRDYFEKGGKQTTNLASINKTVLSMFPVPLPSLEEQVMVIQKLDDTMSLIDSLNQEISTGIEKSEALRQSILKRAFLGKLVAQDPRDEPASVLLERIKAEKNENPKRKKKVA